MDLLVSSQPAQSASVQHVWVPLVGSPALSMIPRRRVCERTRRASCMHGFSTAAFEPEVGSTTREMPCQVSITPTFQSKALYAQQISPHCFQGPGLGIAWDNAGTSSLSRKIANIFQGEHLRGSVKRVVKVLLCAGRLSFLGWCGPHIAFIGLSVLSAQGAK